MGDTTTYAEFLARRLREGMKVAGEFAKFWTFEVTPDQRLSVQVLGVDLLLISVGILPGELVISTTRIHSLLDLEARSKCAGIVVPVAFDALRDWESR